MLVVFLLVADKKIISRHDFVAPLRFYLEVYQATKWEKVYTQGQLKLTHINLVI